MQHLRFQSPAQTRPAITPPPRQGHQGRWYHPRASWSKCLMFHNQRGNIMRYLRDKISRETQALAQGGQAPGGCDACALEHTPAEGPRSAVRDPDTTRAARTALGTRCQQLGEQWPRYRQSRRSRCWVPARRDRQRADRQAQEDSPEAAFQCQRFHHGKKSRHSKGTAFTRRLEGNSLPPMMKENVVSKHTQSQLATQTRR